MKPLVILVTDKIYAKTRRHIEKVRRCVNDSSSIWLATVSGFPKGLNNDSIRDLVSDVIEGSIEELARRITLHFQGGKAPSVLALNQSGILPALALRRLLGLPIRSGFIESCNKAQTRRLLAQKEGGLAMDYREVSPGNSEMTVSSFVADKYVVKPAFGMSSTDVMICNSWKEANEHAVSKKHQKEWVPRHVIDALDSHIVRTDRRIIEPYIEGTEFSIDGWINDEQFYAIVQHKLFMVRSTFIGDGPTVSPPLRIDQLPDGWRGLRNDEGTICQFGRSVLEGIGFSRGVFHIEGREQNADASLRLIEVNPRAPGGSLWKSAFLRTGYDLELVDALIQLDMQVPDPEHHTHRFVLHYPFYARNSGMLQTWGDLETFGSIGLSDFQIDFVARLGDVIHEDDMFEEPYLAFAVAHATSTEDLLEKCHAILHVNPPVIQPRM